MNEVYKIVCQLVDESLLLKEFMKSWNPDSIQIDTMLGKIEASVHDARSAIDDEWKANRTTMPPQPQTATLEDLI